eukprot:2291461-Pyramimonas_sp.AAC.1
MGVIALGEKREARVFETMRSDACFEHLHHQLIQDLGRAWTSGPCCIGYPVSYTHLTLPTILLV